jgi:predicted transcriptional regulator of viral defense system
MIAIAEPVDANQLRLRHEFLSMPGLVLTTTQVARLLGVRTRDAEELLASLEEEGFLMRTAAGMFRRTDPSMS